MKLHIGCGTVYLKDWINVDLPSSTCYLTEERPDLVKAYLTTEKKGYYARHKKQSISKFRRGSLVSEYVCDRYGSFFNLPCRTSNATEILARQSFEHLSITEAKTALKEMNRVLCSRGLLRIDVPDADETLRKLKQTKDDFYIRHYLGPRQSDYGYHCMGYNRETLQALVTQYGFTQVDEEPNIHLYPAFTSVFQKTESV